MVQVILISQDGQKFPVDLEVAKVANVICRIFELEIGCESGPEKDGEEIPITQVCSFILPLVLRWMEYHKEDAPSFVYDEDDERPFEICEWDKEFLKVDKNIILHILMAANYLEIPLLQEVCNKKYASLIDACKTAEEIRREFEIQTDLTPEQEENIRQENINCGHCE